MIYIGLFIASVTEMMERLISVGGFYLSPSRLYFLMLIYLGALAFCYRRGDFVFGHNAKKYLIPVLILLGFYSLSVLASPYFGYSLKRVFNSATIYLMPLVIYFYLSCYKEAYPPEKLLKSVGKVIVLTGIFVAVFGYVQAATGWLQTSFEARSVLGVSIPRINSFFMDKNFLAYFMVFPMWLCVRGGEDLHGLKGRKRLWFAAALMLVAMLMTTSRGGILMMAALAYCVVVDRIAKDRKTLIAAAELPLIIILPLAILFGSYYGFDAILATTRGFDTDTESAASRIFAWYSGLSIYFQNPWFGVGPGNFVTLNKGMYLPINYVPPWVAERISVLAGHSNVLEVLVESGPLSLAAYFGVNVAIYLSLLNAQLAGLKQLTIYRHLCVAAAVGNIFITYYSIFFMFLIGVLLFVLDHSRREGRIPAQLAAGGVDVAKEGR